ncbi:MAG: TRAP transporter large permease subunit [Pseudomonadota bacterium]
MERLPNKSIIERISYALPILLVIVGYLNATPFIPGLDAFVKFTSGFDWLVIREFPTELFYPLVFVLMMMIVVLKHSIWRDYQNKSATARRLGLVLDTALITAAIAIAFTYLAEIRSICLIDQLFGERRYPSAMTFGEAREIAVLNGILKPTIAENPGCITNTGGWIAVIVGISLLVFLAYNVKVWGLPLVMLAILSVAYALATVGLWYVFGSEDMNKYLITELGGEPRLLSAGRPWVRGILTSNTSGLLGQYLGILMNTIFPYLILGALFSVSKSGRSLIRLVFRWTRHTRGGSAHTAIVSSAISGTVSGGPVINVLSTGLLTIPNMVKRGFSAVFAGGVGAAASSGGSIMPPVMGVAAFMLVIQSGVPYRDVIIAAIFPAFAYFLCLFLSVFFQARKQKIQAVGKLTKEMNMSRQDWLNILMIFVPILVILIILLTPKQEIGCGTLGLLLGAGRSFHEGHCIAEALPWFLQLVQNSAGDAGSAGWWGVLLLLALMFLDPELRAKPKRLFDVLSGVGTMIATLYLMLLAISIIDFCLQFTDLPMFISSDVLLWLKRFDTGSGEAMIVLFPALFLTMLLTVILGMGMPAAPAYIVVAILISPVLAGLGLSIFTANLIIFYFAVASAITPPIALAAFAAATVTGQDPMATGFSAARTGVVIFVIPFVLAVYPELLLIEQAQVSQFSQDTNILNPPSYNGAVTFEYLAPILLRLVLAIYLLASAMARYDAEILPIYITVFRLVLAALVMAPNPMVYVPAAIAGLSLVGLGYLNRKEGYGQ